MVEMAFFPALCGWWMDLCTLSVLDSDLNMRLQHASATPSLSFFLHWLGGIVYMLHVASCVTGLFIRAPAAAKSITLLVQQQSIGHNG